MKIPLNLCRNSQKTDIRVVKFCRDFTAFDFRIQTRKKYSAVGIILMMCLAPMFSCNCIMILLHVIESEVWSSEKVLVMNQVYCYPKMKVAKILLLFI